MLKFTISAPLTFAVAFVLCTAVACRGSKSSFVGPALPGFMKGSDALVVGMPRDEVVRILGTEPADHRGDRIERFDLKDPVPGTVVAWFQNGVLVSASFGPTFPADVDAPHIDKQVASSLVTSELTVRAIKGELKMADILEHTGSPGLRVFWKIARPSSALPGDPLTTEVTSTWAWLVDEEGRPRQRAVYVEEVDGVPSQPALRDFPPSQW